MLLVATLISCPPPDLGWGRSDHQVKVIGHKAIGVDLPTGLLAGLAQGLPEIGRRS